MKNLLFCFHPWIFFIDNIKAFFAFAITAANDLVILIAGFQRFDGRCLFHSRIPILYSLKFFNKFCKLLIFFGLVNGILGRELLIERVFLIPYLKQLALPLDHECRALGQFFQS